MSTDPLGFLAIGGFREARHGLTGSQKLHAKVFDLLRPVPNVRVFDLEDWRTDGKAFARKLHALGYRQAIGHFYSWGCGYAMGRFVREFVALGGSVPLIFSCDGVGRSSYLPTHGLWNWFSGRSLLPWTKITVPVGVDRVVWCRQRETRPKGHDLVAEDWGRTHIEAPMILKVGHTDIDDSDQWHARVLAELSKLLVS